MQLESYVPTQDMAECSYSWSREVGAIVGVMMGLVIVALDVVIVVICCWWR